VKFNELVANAAIYSTAMDITDAADALAAGATQSNPTTLWGSEMRFGVSGGQLGGDVVFVGESAEDLLAADPVVCEVDLWVPKTGATWPDAPLTPGCSVPRCLPGRGMISGCGLEADLPDRHPCGVAAGVVAAGVVVERTPRSLCCAIGSLWPSASGLALTRG
jgi:hypothetical protein